MMMNFFRLKYLGVCTIATIFLLNSCNDKDSVTVRVKITSSKDSKIYIDKLNFANVETLDSSDISKGEDNIHFRVKAVSEPTFFVIRVKDKGAITLLCDPSEKVNLIVNTEKLYDYTVLGSKGSQKTKELGAKLSDTKNKLYNLRLKYNLEQQQGVKSMIEQEYNAVIDSQRAYSSRFIWANVMSRASVMAIYQKFDDESYVFDKAEDLVLFKAVASSLRAIYPKSDYTKGMLADIQKMEGIIRSAKLSNMISQSVNTLPDISLSNPKGEIVKLSSLKGKVILLDFWASWDQTSLMDNRKLLEIYSQFKNRGFEIYQVSLDTNRDEWVNAIESASLPWINVSELNPKGSIWARTYNVTQLPANYLIDRSHTIIGKNFYGETLKKKLREIL
jgi:peroxiredoxin